MNPTAAGPLPPKLAVVTDGGLFHAPAEALATALGLPLCAAPAPDTAFWLQYGPDGLSLFRPGDRHGLRVDWQAGKAAHRQRQAGVELLLRACGRATSVLDATAGFGDDTWVLAGGGFAVTAAERHPVMHALLADALARARADARLAAHAACLQLQQTDACRLMTPAAFDCIYLDPMFPAREKRAAVRKPMTYLQALLGVPDDTDALFALALQSARQRVVVKRPLRAAALDARPPDGQWRGRAVRFDMYLTGR